MQKKIGLLSIFFLLGINLWAQELTDSILRLHEDSLSHIFKKIDKQKTDDSNRVYSQTFEKHLISLLNNEMVLHFNFDSLKTKIGILSSEDGALRLYNWNLLLNNGKYEYHCWMQYYNNEKKKLQIYCLQNKADSITEIETTPSSIDAWFGCLYYQMVQLKYQGKNFYTLLGWNGHDLFTNRKIIETLTFTDAGKPVFGKIPFHFEKNKKRRAVFEYAERSSMTLRYDERIRTIVFDHLSPSKEVYKGHAEYYGSDFSYDGLVFEDGVWNYMSDVDVRNNKPPKKSDKKKAKREE